MPSLGLIDPQLCVPESHKSSIRKGRRAEKGGLISVPGCEQRAAQLVQKDTVMNQSTHMVFGVTLNPYPMTKQAGMR